MGQPLVDIETDQQEDDAVTESPSSSKPGTTKTAASVRVSDYKLTWQTPAVRRLLGEYGLNVEDISGSGKNGLVLKEDVLKMISEGSLKRGKIHIYDRTISEHILLVEKKQALEVKKVPLDTAPGDRTVPLTNIQKTMFKTMTDALSIPQLGYKDEIVLNATSEYRKALNEYIQQHTNKFPFKKISYLPIIIKSMSLSLSYFPLLNAKLVTLDDGSTKIQYRDYHHIGIAMDTPQGLIVPNIKHVEKKTIFEIAHEIHRLTDLAKKGALPPADLKGGTITISNIGSIGGTFANPVIVPNELAIVALGTARKLPRFDTKSNALIPQQILPVSWSADHRIIDGATIAQFGNTWKKFIENPAILASELH